jgi:hypothetical protein
MAALRTPRRAKSAKAAPSKRKTAPRASKTTHRKNLSPAMLDALIRHSPPHPAANAGGSNKPPFEPQDD